MAAIPIDLAAAPALRPPGQHVALRLQRGQVQGDQLAFQRAGLAGAQRDGPRGFGDGQTQRGLDGGRQGSGCDGQRRLSAPESLEETFHLAVAAQALGQALPAAGLARAEDRAEPHRKADGLDEQPGPALFQRLAVVRVQFRQQIVVHQHDPEIPLLAHAASQGFQRGDKWLRDCRAQRRDPDWRRFDAAASRTGLQPQGAPECSRPPHTTVSADGSGETAPPLHPRK